MKRKNILFLIRVLVGIGIILALFKFIPYSDLVRIYKGSIKFYFLLVFFIGILSNIIGALRWWYILYSLGIKLKIREIIYAYFSSLFFNLFSPSTIGSDIFRGIALGWHYHNFSRFLPSVILDRLSGVVGLSILSLMGIILGRNFIPDKQVFFILTIFLIVVLFSAYLILNKSFLQFLTRHLNKRKLKTKILALGEGLSYISHPYKVFTLTIVYSIFGHLFTCVVYYLLSKAFFLNISILYFFIFVPITAFISGIPITVVGMGTRDLASVYFLSKIGVEKSVSLSISLVILFIAILIGILGGLIYVVVYHRWMERRA
ncbi:MAG: flippase-like domain-containing protein [Candidatus Omnitrophica bacterium]|nr:flippase-like domain-containing protein [Candidatus Omnitrophota bacterium]MCM8826021.1 flippase-like domain-containing protein [Candidatus Omnitrophota bacterium]